MRVQVDRIQAADDGDVPPKRVQSRIPRFLLQASGHETALDLAVNPELDRRGGLAQRGGQLTRGCCE